MLIFFTVNIIQGWSFLNSNLELAQITLVLFSFKFSRARPLDYYLLTYRIWNTDTEWILADRILILLKDCSEYLFEWNTYNNFLAPAQNIFLHIYTDLDAECCYWVSRTLFFCGKITKVELVSSWQQCRSFNFVLCKCANVQMCKYANVHCADKIMILIKVKNRIKIEPKRNPSGSSHLHQQWEPITLQLLSRRSKPAATPASESFHRRTTATPCYTPPWLLWSPPASKASASSTTASSPAGPKEEPGCLLLDVLTLTKDNKSAKQNCSWQLGNLTR